MSRHTSAATTTANTTASASASASASATTADADDIDDTAATTTTADADTDDTGGLRPGYLALHVIARARAGRSLALQQRRRRPRGGRGVHRRVSREPDLASSPSSPSATTAEAGGRPLSGL